MLQTDEVGRIFAILQASYGNRWPHQPDALPVWQERLKNFKAMDCAIAARKAIDTYPEFPPTLGQFADMVEYNIPQLPAPDQPNVRDNVELADRVYRYTKPYSPIQNPQGNPHHVRLPESTASRNPGESAEQYERRIGSEVTFALYPTLRGKFENS